MKLFNKKPKIEEVEQPSEAIQSAIQATEAVPAVDDGELIAVLAAAINSMANIPLSNLRIKSYRRISQAPPVWNAAARNENSYSTF